MPKQLVDDLIREVLSYHNNPLDHLFSKQSKGDYFALQDCSLVYRQWQYAAQHLLFRRIYLRNILKRRTLEDFAESLEQNPHIAVHVLQLYVIGSSSVSIPRRRPAVQVSTMHIILLALPHIKRLNVTVAICSETEQRTIPFPHCELSIDVLEILDIIAHAGSLVGLLRLFSTIGYLIARAFKFRTQAHATEDQNEDDVTFLHAVHNPTVGALRVRQGTKEAFDLLFPSTISHGCINTRNMTTLDVVCISRFDVARTGSILLSSKAETVNIKLDLLKVAASRLQPHDEEEALVTLCAGLAASTSLRRFAIDGYSPISDKSAHEVSLDTWLSDDEDWEDPGRHPQLAWTSLKQACVSLASGAKELSAISLSLGCYRYRLSELCQTVRGELRALDEMGLLQLRAQSSILR